VAIFKDLKVKLTPSEWEACSAQLGSEQQRLEQVEEEKRQTSSALGSRCKSQKDTVSKLAEKVRSREETRAVECFERKDPRRFVVELYRSDVGSLIETRPMSAGERHEALNPKLPIVDDWIAKPPTSTSPEPASTTLGEHPSSGTPVKAKRKSGAQYRKEAKARAAGAPRTRKTSTE
jgi:hypothetical protein